MKAKVKVNNEDYNREFKIRRLNIDQVIIKYPSDTGMKSYKYEDVELISEGDIDDFLIDNKSFLQVKLNRGISVFFYRALKESIEEEIDGEIIDFNLLKDRYNVNRRGIWEKEIVCFINYKIPLKIICSGKNFKREGYSILINRIDNNNFIDAAKEEISKMLQEIERKNLIIERYEKAIKNTNIINEKDKNIII